MQATVLQGPAGAIDAGAAHQFVAAIAQLAVDGQTLAIGQRGAQAARQLGACVVGDGTVEDQASVGANVVNCAGDDECLDVDAAIAGAAGVAGQVGGSGGEGGVVGQRAGRHESPIAVRTYRTCNADQTAVAVTHLNQGARFCGAVDDLTVARRDDRRSGSCSVEQELTHAGRTDAAGVAERGAGLVEAVGTEVGGWHELGDGASRDVSGAEHSAEGDAAAIRALEHRGNGIAICGAGRQADEHGHPTVGGFFCGVDVGVAGFGDGGDQRIARGAGAGAGGVAVGVCGGGAQGSAHGHGGGRNQCPVAQFIDLGGAQRSAVCAKDFDGGAGFAHAADEAAIALFDEGRLGRGALHRRSQCVAAGKLQRLVERGLGVGRGQAELTAGVH